MEVLMHKAEKYAIDKHALTDEARTFFMKNFGCTRKVYNLYVNDLYSFLEKTGYAPGGLISGYKAPEVTAFKKDYPYLKEADSLGLANTKISFERAVKRFNEEYDHVSYTRRAARRDASGKEKLSFRGLKGMPKFHSRAQGDFSYTTNCQYPQPGNSLKQPTIRLEGTTLFLPKLKGGVKLVLHRPMPGNAVIGNVTISMDTDSHLYASIGYSYILDMDMTLREAAASGVMPDGIRFLGLDYSQGSFYVDSEGRKANYPHCYRQSEAKLAKLQKQLSRMEKDSENYKRKLSQIQDLHVRIRNQRRDFICKAASALASLYDVIGVEDLDLRAMGGALSLGKNLHDNGFGMFRERLSHKLEEKGSCLVKVDRFFPSTKTCSCCGYMNPEVTLGVRSWTCPACGTHHDRDTNAAINIREETKRIFLAYYADWLENDRQARAKAASLSAGRRKKKAA